MGDDDPNAKPGRTIRFLRRLDKVIAYSFCIFFTAFVINEYRPLSARCEMQAHAASWPEARGQVVETRIDKIYSRRSYPISYLFRPIVVYTYATPQGRRSGNVMRFDDDPLFPSRDQAEAMTTRYPLGSPITVRYNPDATGISLVDASPPNWDVVHRIKIALWLIAAAWLSFAIVQLRRIARWMRGQSLLESTDSEPSPHIHKPK